ncbi:MAG TPA: hypothetical protein VIB49_05625 [Thermoplasmata archaeon]|jgi:hypothetical protein
MPTLAEKLWEIGKSPPHNLTYLVFGLIALLTAVVTRSIATYLAVTNTGAILFVAAILGGFGAFFVTLALFLGAYAGSDQTGTGAWRIAQLIGAVVVLFLLL